MISEVGKKIEKRDEQVGGIHTSDTNVGPRNDGFVWSSRILKQKIATVGPCLSRADEQERYLSGLEVTNTNLRE